MSTPVIVYYDVDPIELNPHIFKAVGGRSLSTHAADGPFLVREMMENYLQSRIEAGKPAYLNAVVLAADEYPNPSVGTTGNVVTAICRIPGWDSIPPPYGTKNCIPAHGKFIYNANAERDRQTFTLVDWSSIFHHQIYFPAAGASITLNELLPSLGGEPIPGDTLAGTDVDVKIV